MKLLTNTQNSSTMLAKHLQSVLRLKWLRTAMWGAIPLLGALSFYAISQVTAPKAINLAAEPIYAKGSGAKPTLSLALSVEFPTVGAQYRGIYTVANDYVGYFDINSCYLYNDTATTKHFYSVGPATNHECAGTGFSGNFMNWASSSAIDVLRLGLTGGDRIEDTASSTVLQRAVIPDFFWNSGSYFPAKRLPNTLAAGALPSSMTAGLAGNDIQIANCLNKIHFGTNSEGNCGNPASNSFFGVTSGITSPSQPTTASTTLHNGALVGYSPISCANEGGVCTFTGTRNVAYGAPNSTTWKIGAFTGSVNCGNPIFGDPAPGASKSCYLGPAYVWTAPTAGTPLTTDKFFYTRVKVCNTDASSTDPRTVNGFCTKQLAGNFKPVGNLQKYSDRVRIAAFGYLKDNDYNRYGGVLRAPMKFLGPNNYDQSGALQTAVNPAVEWDPSTGVFTTNPENATEGKSGVINYLNQFGRTSTTPGVYKGYDPMSELYYEALRYVQGLPPTAEAISNITEDMKDGYPVYTSWADPHAGGDASKDYSCVKNNIVAVGDVYTHGDRNIPGNPAARTGNGDTARSYSLASNEPNFHEWTKVVGGFESNNAVVYPFLQKITPATNPVTYQAITPSTSNPNSTGVTTTTAQNATINTARWGMEDQATGSSRSAYYMAGMAYWGNTQDIRGKTWTAEPTKQRPGMRTKTYMIDVNENSGSSNPNTRRNTHFFLTAKYGGFDDTSGIGNPYLNKDGVLDNNNWQKPSEPGEAKTYYLASSAKSVLDGLNEIFEKVATEGNSLANGSISTTSFQSGGYIYNAKYDPSDWSGNVVSTPVIATAGAVNVNVTTPQWEAAKVMNTNTNDYFLNTRKIIAGRSTSNDGASLGSPAGMDFKWSTVDAYYKDALNKSTPAASTGDGLGEARLNYLRGDKTSEGSQFRPRSSKLGDIVNSPVVYSKEFSNSVNTAAYKTFVDNNNTRKGALFVGANDGMMHAFDSEDGKELFAYIPSWLAGKLPALTAHAYNSSMHQSYVDGQTDIAEALVSGAWKTVLLSSTGGGGQGVFALDVSKPENFDASKVMWEFTDRDDADLGNVIGTPRIVKILKNKKTDAVPEYEWYAIVPSGVNNFVADGFASTSQKPHLFLLSLNKVAGEAWVKDTNYFKFEIPTDTTLSASVSPGVINFDATTGSAGELDQVYMGDLHGNLWKLDFDLAGYGKELKDITFLSLVSGNSVGTTPSPLFVAKDSSGNVQPIAIAPKLVYGPNKGTIVMFGTGKYIEVSDNDLLPTRTQSVYAVLDAEFSNTRPKYIADRGFLKGGSSASGTISIDDFVWGRANSASDATQRSGWYFDLPTNGEKSVSDFTVAGAKVYFGTVVPPQNLNDPCGGGSGNIYSVNFATGDGTSRASEVGLIGQIFIQKTTNSVLSDSDSTGRRTETSTERMLIKGTDGFQTPAEDINNVTAFGRLAWRQINNYHELKNQ